jgi:hypothetical protein
MRRRTFDALATVAGLVLALVLLVAGVLLTWGHSFVNDEVANQLSAQKIEFPTTTNPEYKALPKADAAAMGKYAGQLMTNGAQAETYADHFIAYHLTLIGGGKTYSQLSAEAMALPTTSKQYAALEGQVQTVFRGDTLRSMLLNAYGFWKMGQIALIAAIVSYAGAGLMLILSFFGFIHLRRTAPEAEILPTIATRVTVNAS